MITSAKKSRSEIFCDRRDISKPASWESLATSSNLSGCLGAIRRRGGFSFKFCLTSLKASKIHFSSGA
jgi:hypothetical protein